MSNRLRQWIGFLIMVVGLAFLCGPFLLGRVQSYRQERVVQSFRTQVVRYRTEGEPEESAQALVTDSTETAVPEAEEIPMEAELPAKGSEEGPTSLGGEHAIGETNETLSGNKAPETCPNVPTEESAQPAEAAMSTAWQEFYADAQRYHQALPELQKQLRKSSDLERFHLDARDYGFSENIIGTIQIPRLEVELGLYLGANTENMGKGAAILGMTSLPLGEGTENVAIAGHRGWRGTPMFRNIQMLQMDDPIYIRTPWKNLTYRVCDILITARDDSSWCFLKPEHTLISLMTCHPYTQNYQRYIVVAEYIPEEAIPADEEIADQNEATFDPNPHRISMINADGTRQPVVVAPLKITPNGGEFFAHGMEITEDVTVQSPAEGFPTSAETQADAEGADMAEEELAGSSDYGSVLSSFVILAEDKMRYVSIAAALLVGAVGLYLTAATISDLKKRKGTPNESK